MPDKSTFLAGEVLKLITGQALSLTLPITPYMDLMTVMPTKAGGGTPVSGAGYARLNVAGKFGAPATAADPSAAGTSNSSIIDYGTAGATWASSSAPVIGVAIYDAASSGHLIAFGLLASPKPIAASDPVNFPAGTLTIYEA